MNAQSVRALLKGTVIRIKIEVDTDPPMPLTPVLGLVRNPVVFQVPTLSLPDLFAGKLFAALFREWKGRVKGRDWYDVLWYLRKGIPLSHKLFTAYYRQRMGQDTSILEGGLQALFENRLQTLDWEAVRRDVAPFLLQPRSIDSLNQVILREAFKWLQVE